MAAIDLGGLPPIKVVGVGGGGCNAVNRMVEARIQGLRKRQAEAAKPH